MELGVGGQGRQKRCKQIKTKKNFLIYLGFPPLLHNLLPPRFFLPNEKEEKEVRVDFAIQVEEKNT